MNIALIFAGGAGKRMHSGTTPKQFLELHGKPIMIYTLEHFENHPEIDGIVVVCIAGWEDYLRKLLSRFAITKVEAIVAGGETGQDSIYHGLREIHRLHPEPDNIVLVHDGVRPLIDRDTITADLRCVEQHGNAITVSPAVETITVNDGEPGQVGQIIERSRCSLAKAPQCYRLGELWDAHERARAEGRHDFIDSACLMRCYGHPLYSVEGSPNNIKITTPTDFYIFRAIVDARENSQIFGI